MRNSNIGIINAQKDKIETKELKIAKIFCKSHSGSGCWSSSIICR